MKALKKILIGIAIILFGGTIACSASGETALLTIGWGICVLGLLVSLIGYFFDNDTK